MNQKDRLTTLEVLLSALIQVLIKAKLIRRIDIQTEILKQASENAEEAK